ncbi:hypothetical protein ACFQ0G_11965 [Streptomyces chiangmaiensis]
MDLLRWWRFLQAVDVSWDRASRVTICLSSRRAADGSASRMACRLSRPPNTSWHGQPANGT